MCLNVHSLWTILFNYKREPCGERDLAPPHGSWRRRWCITLTAEASRRGLCAVIIMHYKTNHLTDIRDVITCNSNSVTSTRTARSHDKANEAVHYFGLLSKDMAWRINKSFSLPVHADVSGHERAIEPAISLYWQGLSTAPGNRVPFT